MLGNQADFRVVTRNIDAFWVFRADLSELSFKVNVTGLVGKIRYDFAATFFKFSNENICQTHAVVIFNVTKNSDFLHFQSFASKFGHHETLERIDKADAENIITDFSYIRIC
ncbi:hypothetical protein D3C87_1573910 [compost metagenome]